MNNILTGCNRANELIFRFAREAMSLYAGDIHSLLEVRTVNSSFDLCNNLYHITKCRTVFANSYSILF